MLKGVSRARQGMFLLAAIAYHNIENLIYGERKLDSRASFILIP